MPGENRTQADLISATQLQTALQALLASPLLQLDAQMALLAEQQRAFFKKPSVFQTRTAYSYVNYYTLLGSDYATNYWNVIATNQGTPATVVVFNIGDADEVEVTAMLNAPLNSGEPYNCLSLCYALSPDNGINPIPGDQFSLLPAQSPTFDNDVTTPGWVQYFNARLRTAGNKYLHMFGVSPFGDYFNNFINDPLTNSPGQMLTYSLIK